MDSIPHEDQVRRIDELNKRAWEIRIIDSSNALELSSATVPLAREINYKGGLAWALVTQGFGYLRKSEFNLAMASLNECLSIFQFLDDRRGQAAAFEYQGIVQRNLGEVASALQSIFNALNLSRQTSFTEIEATNLYQIGVTYRSLANYEKALDNFFQSLEICRANQFELMEGYCLNVIGSIYFETLEYEKALTYFQQALPLRRRSGDKWGEAGSLDAIGYSLLKLKKYDRAIKICSESLELSIGVGDKKGQANALIHLAEAHNFLDNKQLSLTLAKESLEIRKNAGDRRGQAEAIIFISNIEELDETRVAYLNDSLLIANNIKALDLISTIHLMLHKFFKQNGDYKSSLFQFEKHYEAEKELHKNTIAQKIANLEIAKEAEEIHKNAEVLRVKNEALITLNSEIEFQKQELEKTLVELKTLQGQLIQSEKMASLGELTAGIAHEIQNPLNFVNNFSEINKELLEELTEELISSSKESTIKIITDVQSNFEKINQHGKRADAIVKAMLQHSRPSSSRKELTDINALCDEYLRLSYHGCRAKDKSFNAKSELDLDPQLPKIEVVPPDVGRVILNLINNAFYAVSEEAKQKLAGYEPMVRVSTRKLPDTIEIRIKDNGSGIPDSIKEKIFHPFFTTKPTGHGTGLGLSLSYDIVKAHGGNLKVESVINEGAEFVIEFPLG